MNRVFKTFLLWLLIAALPLQGWAAARQAYCGPAHHQSALVVMAHESRHAGEDHTMHAMHDASADDSQHAEHASATPIKHKNSSCSACAACSVGAAAPPSSLPSANVHVVSDAIVLPTPNHVTGYVPAGLERPPRPVSA